MLLTFKKSKSRRFRVSAILCTAFLAALGMMLTGCGKSYKEAVMKKYADYTKTAGYSYLCNWFVSSDSIIIGDKITVGGAFTLEEDCYLDTLTLFFNSMPDCEKNVKLKIYKWDESYEKSIKGRAVSVSTLKDFKDSGGKIFHFEEGKIGPGKYCYVLSSPKEASTSVTYSANDYDHESFYCGVESPNAPISFITYNKYVKDGPTNAPTKLTPGKAHVIILTGQSNATGRAPVSELDESKAPKALLDGLEKGFDTIQIKFALNTGAREQTEFSPVLLGQSADTEHFGPEVGLAYKLSKTYPDETFYVLKYSCSGAGLSKHFQDNNGEWQYLSKRIKKALDDMKKDGLDPEVFAVLWMQGETDSWSYDETNCYAEKQEDFINRVKKLITGYEAPNGFTFIDAAISESSAWTLSPIINAQKRICDAKDINYVFVDTVAAGLISGVENDDIAHYGPHDQVELGYMFADEIIKVIETK